MAEAAFDFAAAEPEHLETLVMLRIAAMRPNLERIGRFDPERARKRLVDSFRPAWTRLILVDGALAGCVALGPDKADGLWLEHFYLDPAHQGRGLGSAVMRRLLAEVDAAGAAVRLSVLLESPANRFYPRYGFAETHREGVDIYYRRTPAGS